MHIYNQLIERFTRNGCTIYTKYGIVTDMWGLIFLNKEIIETLKKAELKKAWSQTRGAYFHKIDRFFTDFVYDLEGLKLNTKKVSVYSKDFETMCKQGYSFGLGLKKSTKEYRQLANDGILDKKDIDQLKKITKFYGHNHRYYKGLIGESLDFEDNTIEMDIDTLRYAVGQGVYYKNARTLVPGNDRTRLVCDYLKQFKDRPDSEIIAVTDAQGDALKKASSLTMDYKIGRDEKGKKIQKYFEYKEREKHSLKVVEGILKNIDK